MFEHMMQCMSNKEQWNDNIEPLTKIFNKHKIDPVLRILLNKFLIDPNQDISEVLQTHSLIDFNPYQALNNEQKRIGCKQLR